MKRQFPTVPLLGLTATATQDVMRDVTDMLGVPRALILRSPTNRPNLFYEVMSFFWARSSDWNDMDLKDFINNSEIICDNFSNLR